MCFSWQAEAQEIGKDMTNWSTKMMTNSVPVSYPVFSLSSDQQEKVTPRFAFLGYSLFFSYSTCSVEAGAQCCCVLQKSVQYQAKPSRSPWYVRRCFCVLNNLSVLSYFQLFQTHLLVQVRWTCVCRCMCPFVHPSIPPSSHHLV